ENMNLAADTSVSDYRSTILSKNTDTEKAAKEFIGTSSWSDLQAFDIIHSAIPANSDVQMGNSSVVRYILLNDARADLRYFGNRGVAGIDGCTSTAVGAAHLTSRLTTLISGDIAFFYDSNAFWNNLNKTNLRIIVINNGGGGIFRIIDGPDATSPALSTYFETAHTRSAAGLAAMYGLAFRSAQNAPTLEQGLDWLYSQQDCAILEVSTPQLENSPILKEYFERIRRMPG
ncbi:MAG: thiamine pyrophosphate-dependent enzyme, partial [Flavobacteriales bacterium]